MAGIQVTSVETAGDLETFLRVPWRIYAEDPQWVPPLLLERRQHLSPKHNPWFEHAEARLWIAWSDGEPVGRISAQVDRLRLEQHRDEAGTFGFLEAIDHPEAFSALFSAAEDWLRSKGLRRAFGPFSLSINDESGLLVDGFDRPPSMMMGHARPWYGPRVEEQGYSKARDLMAYWVDMTQPFPDSLKRLIASGIGDSRVTFRPMDFSRYTEELRLIVDIFNDAWRDNWGFVPMTEGEVRHLAKSLRPLIKPEWVTIGEVEGEPAAFAVTLPNVNEAIADLNGRLLPFGLAKLLWRIKVRGTTTGRMPLMGVRKRYQGGVLGAALALGVIERAYEYHRARGRVTGAELSWVLENNRPIRRLIERLAPQAYKTYRIYQKELS
ncbi:dATP pyrophosphohydrolase [Aquibaculum sediminis]|uniref:dATP pyrophosphohydrolase n=1 Tax=Aquibaculum sediminis TaxID=3231907 RepID=UPI0034529770